MSPSIHVTNGLSKTLWPSPYQRSLTAQPDPVTTPPGSSNDWGQQSCRARQANTIKNDSPTATKKVTGERGGRLADRSQRAAYFCTEREFRFVSTVWASGAIPVGLRQQTAGVKTFDIQRPEMLVAGTPGALDLDAHRLQRAVRTGNRVRVRRGVYVSTDYWREASPADRYLLRVHAVVQTRVTPRVLGYVSAAALWGYPRVGAWPVDVHVIVPPQLGAHSKHGIRFHRESLDEADIAVMADIELTSPARTLIDLARSESFGNAVVAVDAALNARRSLEHGRVTKQQLVDALNPSRHAAARALRVVEFADGMSANPGESLSRIAIFENGFLAPQLQTEHPNPDGGRYFTDFEWPEHRLIGEFDGRGKYLKDELLAGRDAGEVVYEEKRREDHLRAEGNRVVRWGWRELQEPGRLVALLSASGLPYRSRRRNPL